jgi:alpha-L-fucosidase 2
VKILLGSKKFNYQQLLSRHLQEYKPLFSRMNLRLGSGPQDKPTDQRLIAFRNGADDPALIALYYQYGRYLLLSSSRAPARLPANLQGKWNHHFDAPWDSDYHTNINLQMNYWPADVANTGTTFEPLASFMMAMLPPGRQCAVSMYGAGGWAMHHVTDIYGRTSINADPIWGTSPLAGAWMALSMYDHYDFTRDEVYLKRVFPIIKGSADFIMDFLIMDPQGQLVTAPSMSPENSFYLPDSSRSVITYAPAIDVQIIRELFSCIRRSANITGVDRKYLERLNDVEAKLPPTKINSYGGIMEWIKDYGEVEPGHRHMSHLFGLYPGTTLTRDEALLQAARKTLDHRLANGGGHTGWSRAWMISFFARLQDHEQAYHHVQQLLRKSTHINLFDDHPPFQIDGNFGGTAGISEMLIQSHNDMIQLLPALPAAWTEGEVRGLRARGGFVVDMAWKNGGLLYANFHAEKGGIANIKYKSDLRQINIQKGKSITFRPTQP